MVAERLTRPTLIGPNTRVIVIIDGDQVEVPIKELDREHRGELENVLRMLDCEAS